MQSIALVNAKLCMWKRKALHVGTQSFALKASFMDYYMLANFKKIS